MNCLIVDDEALARRLLADYISKIPDIKLVASCMSALEAQQYLEKEEVDLMFLDIQMPDLTGINFLKSLSKKPLTVFTTAYSEYALEGYELSIIDYLVKPIPFERFYQSISKAKEYLGSLAPAINDSVIPENRDYFFVKADYKVLKIKYKEVLFIEGLREYVRIHTINGKVISLLSMNKLEEVLPFKQFIRIHRSTIINMEHIDMVQGNLVVIGSHQLTISKSQKDRFYAKINTDKLF